MVHVKKSSVITLILFLIPTVTSLLAAVRLSPLLMLATALLDFAVIAVNPSARKRENLYMFVLASLTASPICLSVIFFMLKNDLFAYDLLFAKLLYAGFIFFIMISILEIILGLLTRFIWKKQYRLTLNIKT